MYSALLYVAVGQEGMNTFLSGGGGAKVIARVHTHTHTPNAHFAALMQMKAFVACLLFIRIYRSRQESYESLWSTENARRFLKATMSLMRFRVILSLFA